MVSRERESERLNEKKLPPLSRARAIFPLCCFNLGVSFHSRRLAVSQFSPRRAFFKPGAKYDEGGSMIMLALRLGEDFAVSILYEHF